MMQQPNYAPGMRHAAAQLRERADRLASVISRIDGQLTSMSYSGPAADRFRSTMAGHRSTLTGVHGHMTETVNILLRGAQAEENKNGIGGMA